MIKLEVLRAKELDLDKIRPYLLGELRKHGEQIAKEFNKTTVGWKKRRPKFEIKLSTSKFEKYMSVSVFTENEIWNYIDKGVEGHDIIPRKARVSGTAGTYISLSLPGTLTINPSGGRKVLDGNYFNLNHQFYWTGIKAREFSTQIAEKQASDPSKLQRNFQAVFSAHANKLWKD